MVITLTLIPAAGCSSHVTTVTVSYKVLVNLHVTQGCLTSLVVTTLTLGRFIAVALTQHCHKHNWGVAVVLFWIPCHSCCQETRVTKEALWILTEFIPSERGPNFTHSVQCVRTSIMLYYACYCNSSQCRPTQYVEDISQFNLKQPLLYCAQDTVSLLCEVSVYHCGHEGVSQNLVHSVFKHFVSNPVFHCLRYNDLNLSLVPKL